MTTSSFPPLIIACPACGSNDIAYSCHPGCCFNHVCGACLQSFELSTEFLGENPNVVQMQIPEKDLSQPTVACARCQSLAVYSTGSGEGNDGKLACAACHALLKLDIAIE
jgi:hypothetical protein